MQRKALWVEAMMDASESTASKIKVTPVAIVAQAALESAWGQSTVGTHGLFGVKADASWTGARVLARTREVVNGDWVVEDDWFRDYPSFEACLDDHFSFLYRNTRYRDAGVFDGKGDINYFEALQHAGYATDPRYASILESVAETIRGYFLKDMTTDTSAPSARLLMIGCTGADVAALQAALGMTPDSQFGPVTLAAVKTFQEKHNLDADGVVGPATRLALGI